MGERLEILELGHNDFEDFPFNILELTSLKYIDLRCNHIKKIPPNINTLKNLEYLNLNRNEIKKFNSGLTDLNGLKHLELNFNEIKKIPETLKQLKYLEVLNLDFNKLVTLPNSIGLLKNIKKLHFHGNRINTMPESLLRQNTLKLFSMDTTYLDDKSNLILARLAQNDAFICKPPFTIRFFLGTPQTYLWGKSENAKMKYNYPIDPEKLPLSLNLMKRISDYNDEYLAKIEKLNGVRKFKSSFKSKVKKAFAKLREELGKDFHVICEMSF